MVSVIIAAHNEEGVIGECLDALHAQHDGPPLQVIVSANGCTDATAAVAARHGATVIDRATPGKAAALNAAEEVADSFPRIYLDADIIVPPAGIAQLVAALSTPGVLATVPRRRVDTTGRPWPVRAYFAINDRLPVFRTGLFGRGMIGVTSSGRARFDRFPTLIADDLFVDSLFSDTEKMQVSAFDVRVQAPRRTRDLIARLVRVRRGNADMRAAAAAGTVAIAVRPSDRWAWLRDVVIPHPWLAPAALVYITITLIAGIRAHRPGPISWGQDTTTRSAASSVGA